MATLIVPKLDEKPWPTLGGQVCDFIEERAIFGPGDLKGQPARLSPEKRAIVYRAYEVYPPGHPLAGRRRFKRVGWSVRKGLAKTEVLAWIAYVELHPEAPVRGDGFDAWGEPVGRPVDSPYIPLLAYTKDQTEELAYGALYTVVTEGPDADLFDPGLDRIIRLDDRGRADGKAVPLAGSPNAADGARTTFQGFDEPHRLYLPRLREAHDTMDANLPKRPAADGWSLYVGTAGQPGQNSIAEDLHHEAQSIARGEVADPRIFYIHRDAGQCHRGDKENGHNLTTMAGRIAAITEATGPEGEYGQGQFADIAEKWDRPRADHSYLERVWLNLWTQSARQAFDALRIPTLTVAGTIAPGSLVTAGFDGARYKDSTAIVVTEVTTGLQMLWALWERPPDLGDDDEWEVPENEVTASVNALMSTFEVWRFNGDPPHWTEPLGSWAGRYACVEEWPTYRRQAMAYAVRDYYEAMTSGAVTYATDPRPALDSPIERETLQEALARHIAAAGRVDTNLYDDDGNRLWILNKLHETRKFDACMAAILSWQARLEALKKGAKKTPRRSRRVRRVGS
ncbi:large terminase [Nocardioides lentus]|uniref:Large terminase n=1 Tax=Nocardioides lentus TaxID=338077 RepID=A0ABP5ABC6_9ACTN